jgi:biotin carboxyl carrier protein
VIHKYVVEIDGSEREVTAEPLDGGKWRVVLAGRARVIEARRLTDGVKAGTWSIVGEGGGKVTIVDVDGAAPDLTVTVDNLSVPIKVVDARRKLAGAAAARPQASGPTAIKSPMPGKVVKLLCKAGDSVKSGQGVAIVEAMKMENELRAPRDGKIKDVVVKEGQPVEGGQTLATIE